MGIRKDEMIDLKPVNRTAALILKKGISYEHGQNFKNHYDNPIEIKNITESSNSLIGLRFGRFTVIGKVKPTNAKQRRKERFEKGLGYLLRCSCGQFESKKYEYIKKNIKNVNAKCAYCDHIEQLSNRKYIQKKESEEIKVSMYGKKLGKYKILEIPENGEKQINILEMTQWIIQCDCGYIFKISYNKIMIHEKTGKSYCNECNIKKKNERTKLKKEYFEKTGEWPQDNFYD